MFRCRSLLALTVALLATCSSAVAADGSTSRYATSNLSQYQLQPKRGTVFLNPDIYFDYEVWAAPEVTNYYVVAEWQNGSVSEFRYTTQAAANQFVQWLYFHIAELKKATIDVRDEAGEYVLIDTFDKHADAVAFAELLQSVGLYTQIKSVSTLQFNQP